MATQMATRIHTIAAIALTAITLTAHASAESALAAYTSAACGITYNTAPLSEQSLMLAAQDFGLEGGTDLESARASVSAKTCAVIRN